MVIYRVGGKTNKGKKRYRCAKCNTTLSQRRPYRQRRVFNLFGEYVLRGRTYESLARQSGISQRKLVACFQHFLLQAPPKQKLPLPKLDSQYLVYDGLWFGKKFCLMAYRVYQDPLIIHASIYKTERSSQIARDLETIKERGYLIDGLVSDGGSGVTKAAKRVFPFTPHQVCLAHVSRQATLGLGRHPKDYRLHKLKGLADHLFLIESKEALGWWLSQLKSWGKTHGQYLN